MKALTLLFVCCIITHDSSSQSINLAEQVESEKIIVVNREISAFESNGIELSARAGDGLAILESIEFDTGTVLIEIQGKNAPGKSFVGFAFNIQNDTTYEAIYFRPFNFVAGEPVRKSHMVQYISHPEYTWHKLRAERTGEFEGELETPPVPENWFLAKIDVTDDSVVVYVNEDEKPVLEISRLTNPKSSKIGLWTGNGSSGRFRNLSIQSEK